MKKLSKGWIWGIVTIAIIGILILVPVTAYIGNHNYGNKAEETIKAEYSDMENILSQYSNKISEAVQVNSMYKDDLKDVISSALSSRYGNEGSKAMFQWIKEHDVNLDADVYKKIQQMIEGGRNKFENAQTRFIDTKRVYKTNLGYLWKGYWLEKAGFPTLKWEDYAIISNDSTKETFKTKIDNGLKLR